jgi:hypothetical protein
MVADVLANLGQPFVLHAALAHSIYCLLTAAGARCGLEVRSAGIRAIVMHSAGVASSQLLQRESRRTAAWR